LYCARLMVHDNPSNSCIYQWNPNSRPLHIRIERSIPICGDLSTALPRLQRTTYKSVAWQGRRTMPNTKGTSVNKSSLLCLTSN
jgi:hypothetical protein